MICTECGNEMSVNDSHVSNHTNDGEVDHEQDAQHVAIADEDELTHISIYGFETEENLDNNKEKHIDSITKDGFWERCVIDIIAENKNAYYHITVESDDGKPLPSFS